MNYFRKHLFILCAITLCGFRAYAQNNNGSASLTTRIDSLKKVLLTAKEDTNKVNVLNGLAWELKNSNLDTGIIISTQALGIAEKIKFEIGIGKTNHQLGIFYKNTGDYVKALECNFKALALWDKLEKDLG